MSPQLDNDEAESKGRALSSDHTRDGDDAGDDPVGPPHPRLTSEKSSLSSELSEANAS